MSVFQTELSTTLDDYIEGRIDDAGLCLILSSKGLHPGEINNELETARNMRVMYHTHTNGQDYSAQSYIEGREKDYGTFTY